MASVPLSADSMSAVESRMSRFFAWHLPNQDAHFGAPKATSQWPLTLQEQNAANANAEEKESEEPQQDDKEDDSEEDTVPLGASTSSSSKKSSGASSSSSSKKKSN